MEDSSRTMRLSLTLVQLNAKPTYNWYVYDSSELKHMIISIFYYANSECNINLLKMKHL